ncbi:MAG: hypothetical protein JWM10_4218 [Myxococcaceae bacterium]|nr:hypothetical protein [Myxococcaceae bacterium]
MRFHHTHLALALAFVVGAGCSTGDVADPAATPDPSAEKDYDSGPYPDDLGLEGEPLPPDDAGPKPVEPPAWPDDAGEPPDPPTPPPEDAGEPPPEYDDANAPLPDDAFTDPSDDTGPLPADDAGVVEPAADAGVPVAVDAGVPVAVDAGAPMPSLLPRYSVVFSRRPADNRPDLTVENTLVALIDRAVPGSRIRLAVYHLTRARLTAALVRAARRGVDVRVLLDGGVIPALDDPEDNAEPPEAAALILGLGRSRVTLCRAPGTACLGTGIMHHKTYLFSDVGGGSRSVVVQASHNLTNTQNHLHNNAVIVRGDSALFAAYERTFEQQRRDVVQRDYYRVADGSFATRAYFFPRAAGDTVVGVIDNVSCQGAARIRVAMSFFTDARLEVARALARRQRAGCDVQAVIGDAGIRVGRSVLSTLRGAGVTVTLFPARTGGWGLHSKYMIIDARYAGSSAHRHLVFTGSHNWLRSALRDNDETMLRVENDGVFEAYLADWARVRDSARRR